MPFSISRRYALALMCAASAGTAPLFAQQRPTPRDRLLVSGEWLSAHLADPNLVLLHVGDSAEYAANHLPRARFVAPSDVSVSDPAGLTLELPPAAVLRDRLAALGISDDSRIVVYYGKDRVTFTTRIMLTLDHAGLGDRVSVLDGGMPQWIAEGRTVTSVVEPARVGSLSPLRTKPVTVDADFVRARLNKPGVSIVDARATPFYDGAQTGGGRGSPHRTGHIAGAKSLPFSEITDAAVRMRSTNELESLFAKAGVAPQDTVVAYCHIGQQGTAIVFAARLLGRPVFLYDGSFEDWSKHPVTGFPVAVTPARTP